VIYYELQGDSRDIESMASIYAEFRRAYDLPELSADEALTQWIDKRDTPCGAAIASWLTVFCAAWERIESNG